MVFFAKNIVDVKLRPVDSNAGIVINESAFIFGMVEFVAFVGEFGRIGHNEKAVREAAGNEELLFILSRGEDADVFAIGF